MARLVSLMTQKGTPTACLDEGGHSSVTQQRPCVIRQRCSGFTNQQAYKSAAMAELGCPQGWLTHLQCCFCIHQCTVKAHGQAP